MLKSKFFLQEVDQEYCGWNRICQILILTLWLVTPPCFLGKIAQILQIVIIFFPEREEEIKLLFDIFGWSFSALPLISFDFSHLQWKQGIKVRPKVLTLGPSLFHKNLSPSKNFQIMFLFARVLQSWTKYLRQTLVFMWNSIIRVNFNSIFQQFFASINKIFLLGGRLGATL